MLSRLRDHIDAFAIDVNAMATQAYIEARASNSSLLFRDKHHPTEHAHAAIARALFFVVAPFLSLGGESSSSGARPTWQVPTVSASLVPVISYTVPGAESRQSPAERLIWTMLRQAERIRSLTHNAPAQGDSREYATASLASSRGGSRGLRYGVAIKRSAFRSDSTSYAWFPACSAAGWNYVLRLRSAAHGRPRFFGLCFAGTHPHGKSGKRAAPVCAETVDWRQIEMRVCARTRAKGGVAGGFCLRGVALGATDVVDVRGYEASNVLGRGVMTPLHWLVLPAPADLSPPGAGCSDLKDCGDNGTEVETILTICKRHVPGEALLGKTTGTDAASALRLSARDDPAYFVPEERRRWRAGAAAQRMNATWLGRGASDTFGAYSAVFV